MLKKNILENKTYNEIFEKNSLFWDYLSKNAYPLTKGELRIPISLEPFVISEKQYKKLQEDLKLIISAAKKIVNLYFEFEEVKNHFDIEESEKELINLSQNQDFTGILRADIFFSEKPQIVELNSDFPDGFFMHDITTEALLFNLDKSIHSRYSHSSLFSSLLESLNISKNSHLFIGYNKNRFFKDEFELNRIELNKLGYLDVSVGALEDLELKKDNFFYYKGKKVDFIRRCSEFSKIRDNSNLTNKFKTNLEKSNTIILNNFKMRLLGNKNLLFLMHKSSIQKYLSNKEIKAISNLIPKTFSLSEIEIDDFLENKDKWVLKASDLAEGENVYLGEDLSLDIWKEKLIQAKNSKNSWIIQEKIHIPQTQFTIVDEKSGEIKKEMKKFDFNPHIILYKDKIEFGNILVRFSDSSILNVMKGGGITYTLIKKD